jgi:hypothetical protein
MGSIVKRFMYRIKCAIAVFNKTAMQTPAYTRVCNEAVYGFVIVDKDGF